MTNEPLYFDVMASTPLDPRVLEAMIAVMKPPVLCANPSARTHSAGYKAASIVAAATEQAANALGCSKSELTWTSGASESIHLAVLGAAKAYRRQGNHVISMSTEHKASLAVMNELEKEGGRVTLLDPLPSGKIDLDVLEKSFQSDTVLLSLLWVNNETGVIQDIQKIAALCKKKGVLLHVDAAQAIGKLPLNLSHLGADLVSLSAHKCYGPKGVGLLYHRQNPAVLLSPMISGGAQQKYRSGTLPTHQMVGAAKAIDIAMKEQAQDEQHAKRCRDMILSGLNAAGGIHWHAKEKDSVPHCLSCHVTEVDIGALLDFGVDLGLATGSACNAATKLPSHVLLSMGLDEHKAHHSLRISYGRFTTEEECSQLVDRLLRLIKQLRSWSPGGAGNRLLQSGDLPSGHPRYSSIVWERCCSLKHLGCLAPSESVCVYENETENRHVRFHFALGDDGVIAASVVQARGPLMLLVLCDYLCDRLEGLVFSKVPELLGALLDEGAQCFSLQESERHLIALIRGALR